MILFALTTVLILFAAVFYFAIWPWVMLSVGSLFSPNPPKPQITYGEFPFTLIYEIDGERKIINDTLICEFDGFGGGVSLDKYREWKGTLASGNDSIVLWSGSDVSDVKGLYDFGEVDLLEVYYDIPPAWFYMGDYPDNFFEAHEESFSDVFEYYYVNNYSRVWFEARHSDGSEDGSSLGDEELYDMFKIRIISWTSAPPIENTF
jgi:hypothetical protein